MKTQYDLSQLKWRLSGWTPFVWRMNQTVELGETPSSEILAIPAKVPGSVQESLKQAGTIPDWNNYPHWFDCEWVENRHWIYEAVLPKEWIEKGKTFRLHCEGLDYAGCIVMNGKIIAEFCGSYVPYEFDLTPHLTEDVNVLRIAFENSPRWLGQFGFTSKMKEWKPRFNYTWDWTVRLMQIGIWDSIYIEATDCQEIRDFKCVTDAQSSDSTGSLKVEGRAIACDAAKIKVMLAKDGKTVKEDTMSASQFTAVGIAWSGIPVELWWPNLHGDQPLYDVTVTLMDQSGKEIDKIYRRVGFKEMIWVQNEDAPEGADPWICVVNGKPIFLQGINWVPIRPNFADLTEADYKKRIDLYKELGLNILRVWGGAVLEKETFYNLCDEAGIMVWQEFPLSSSGGDSIPPDDEKSVNEMAAIAKSYINRRQYHVSLAVWSGGNELVSPDNESPATLAQPMIKRFQQVVQQNDPTRRFLETSATGPKAYAHAENYGKGLHWDVHGPWKPGGDLKEWAEYWAADDALFRSESGSPGTSSVEIIRQHAGDCEILPIAATNMLWRLPMPWWLENDQFAKEHGRQPENLEEYVAWSQNRQAEALTIVVKACKDRFPKCGGVILWMGHDCFPCPANTSVVDFNGDPKPAAIAISKIFKQS
ncbi:MAG: glycoside hydrolase family 2 protein [Armatimonadota bacterium]